MLFAEQRQRDRDHYTQELRKLFSEGYPEGDNNVGKLMLASHFVAGLTSCISSLYWDHRPAVR